MKIRTKNKCTLSTWRHCAIKTSGPDLFFFPCFWTKQKSTERGFKKRIGHGQDAHASWAEPGLTPSERMPVPVSYGPDRQNPGQPDPRSTGSGVGSGSRPSGRVGQVGRPGPGAGWPGRSRRDRLPVAKWPKSRKSRF